MKFIWYTLLLIIIAFLMTQLYRLSMQNHALNREFAELTRKTKPLQKENKDILEQLQALKNPGNLEREFRRAGFAAPGEKVFIIVPKQ